MDAATTPDEHRRPSGLPAPLDPAFDGEPDTDETASRAPDGDSAVLQMPPGPTGADGAADTLADPEDDPLDLANEEAAMHVQLRPPHNDTA
jgi:hypothetical protein